MMVGWSREELLLFLFQHILYIAYGRNNPNFLISQNLVLFLIQGKDDGRMV